MGYAKYYSIAKTSCHDALFYRAKLISSLVMWTFRVGVLFALYSYAYHYTGKDVSGISLSTALWSIGVYFVMLALGVRRLHREIADEVRTGTIETRINKPYHYLLYRMAARVGTGLPDFCFSLLAALPLLFVFVAFPQVSVSWRWCLQFLSLLVTGIFLALWVYSLVGLSAMWLVDSDPVFWITDKAVMILGGSYVPVALFPKSLQLVSAYSPFGAMSFAARAFNPGFSAQWLSFWFTQLAWLAILMVMTLLVYRRANRKLSINGG